MAATQDMKAQLTRQLSFLHRSARLYDEGFDDESIRIAVSIRVLLHNRKNSVSLLSHLGKTGTLLLSTASPQPLDATVLYAEKLNMHGISRGKFGPMARTSLDICNYKRLLPALEWWSEIIYGLNGELFSRGDLVRAAADKDGGAHVDAKLADHYAFLLDAWTITSNSETTKTTSIYASLRTMAFELLNSPDLLSLTA